MVPVSPERIRTRSQTWLAIQRPRPPVWVGVGRTRPTSGCSMRPASATSTTSAPGSRQRRVGSVAAAVANAVGGELAGGEDEVGGALAGEAADLGLCGDQATQVVQSLAAEGEFAGAGRGRLEAAGEGVGRVVELAALAVGVAVGAVGQVRVAIRRRLQYLVLERVEVVGTEQRPGQSAAEGDVE